MVDHLLSFCGGDPEAVQKGIWFLCALPSALLRGTPRPSVSTLSIFISQVLHCLLESDAELPYILEYRLT